MRHKNGVRPNPIVTVEFKSTDYELCIVDDYITSMIANTELSTFTITVLDAGVPVCPVAVRARVAGRPTTATAQLPGESWWRSAARVLGAVDLVVEVHQLAPIDPRRGTATEVAALAEYAIAAVLETDPPRPLSHPRRPRTHAPAVSPRTPVPR